MYDSLIPAKFSPRSRSTRRMTTQLTTGNDGLHANTASKLYKITAWNAQDRLIGSPPKPGSRRDSLAIRRSLETSVIRTAVRQIESDSTSRHRKLPITHKNSMPIDIAPSKSPQPSDAKGKRIKFDDNNKSKYNSAEIPFIDAILNPNSKSPEPRKGRALFIKIQKKQALKS